MTIVDKVEIIKNVLKVIIKVSDVLVAVIDKVIERVGA